MIDLDPVLIRTCLDSNTPLDDATVRAVVEEWLAQPPIPAIEAMIARLVAEERESCALIADIQVCNLPSTDNGRGDEVAREIAAEIRARGAA